MPPETKQIKLPNSRYSEEAAEWLESHSLVDQCPSLRSSDYGLVRRCPFTYYLCRRLGLGKALQYSEALSRGTWVHHFFSYITLDEETRTSNCYVLLNNRLSELNAQCDAMNIRAEKKKDILLREETDFLVTKAWFEAALMAPISKDIGGLKEFLEHPDMLHVGQELLLKAEDRVAQPDLLIYDKRTNKLWIVDFKTCAGSPHDRLQMCPYEFQTQHYFSITRHLLLTSSFTNWFDLPSDVDLAGVMHIAIQKPTIKFGMSDRPFTMDTSPLKSGPRKGQPRNDKVYTGEPHPDLYRERCINWYLGHEDYAHLAPERATDPPVNISYTGSRTLLAEDNLSCYDSRLKFLKSYKERPCEPGKFEVGDVVPHAGRVSPYASFITTPVDRWIDIIEAEQFIISNRDDKNLDDGVHASFLSEVGS